MTDLLSQLGWILALLFAAAFITLVISWELGSDWLVRLILRLEQRRNGLCHDSIQVGDIRFHYLTQRSRPFTTPPQTVPDADAAATAQAEHAAVSDERPVLLLLHGFGGDCNHWLRCAPFLAKHFRLLIPDLPGFGQTPLPDNRPGNMEAQAERVHMFLEALGVEQCMVAGNSMGAYLAATFGWLYPQMTQALWLLNPGGVHAAEFTELLQTAAGGGHNLLIPETLHDFRLLRSRAFIRQPLLPLPVAKAVVRRCTQRRQLYQRLFDELCYQSTPMDRFSHELKCPVLLVWGDSDHVLHPSGAEVLAQLLPRGKLIVMSGVGHCPMIEVPRESANDFIQFVKSCFPALTLSEPAVHH